MVKTEDPLQDTAIPVTALLKTNVYKSLLATCEDTCSPSLLLGFLQFVCVVSSLEPFSVCLCHDKLFLSNAHVCSDNLLEHIPPLCSPSCSRQCSTCFWQVHTASPTIPPYLTIPRVMALTPSHRWLHSIQNTLSLTSATGVHMWI